MITRTLQSRKAMGVLLSIIGLGMAVAAALALSAANLGNALIFAGGALSMCLMPFSDLRQASLRKTLTEVATDAARNPPSLGMGLLTLLCWVLILSGLVVSVIRA